MKRTQMGMNRTGMGMAPRLSTRMMEISQGAATTGVTPEMKMERARYIAEAEAVGSVPLPTKLKGIASAVLERLSGDRAEVLIDKLGERMAFERMGTRLYETLIQKVEAGKETVPAELLDLLRHNRDDEQRHFKLVYRTLEKLGADPTAVTPGADVSGLACSGLAKVLGDPRTTVLQGIQAILVAELTDRDGWELLIQLMNQAGLDGADEFQAALREEERHLSDIRAWYASINAGEARVGLTPGAEEAPRARRTG